jgi:2-polyprenyl-3-methyl-5-hydroxy-6-metoxy-1,4-benzoquinol methylase
MPFPDLKKLKTLRQVKYQGRTLERIVKDNIEGLKKKIIPPFWHFPEDVYCSIFDYRPDAITYGGFSCVAQDWVSELAQWIGNRKCLEIGAGRGLLAKALHDNEVDIVATDNYCWEDFGARLRSNMFRRDKKAK